MFKPGDLVLLKRLAHVYVGDEPLTLSNYTYGKAQDVAPNTLVEILTYGLDNLATFWIPALNKYSICFDYGLFKEQG